MQQIEKELNEFKKILSSYGIEPTADGLADALDDYQKAADMNARMIRIYETEITPRMIAGNVYICPTCGRRVAEHHSHCHFCGQKLGWTYIERDYRKRRGQKHD